MIPRPNLIRLSLFQESFWFLRLLDPVSGSFNIGRSWALIGEVDEAALQNAVDSVTERHSILRSQIVIADGLPYMLPLPGGRNICQVSDYSEFGEAALSMATSFLRDEYVRQFDFEAGSLIRVYLVRLSGQESLLMIVKPHIITDVKSMEIFATEVAAFYSARITGREVQLPAPRQFFDYAQAQRDFSYSDKSQPHLEYWRRTLTGLPEKLSIRAQCSPIEAPSSHYAGHTAEFDLPDDLIYKIDVMRRAEGDTQYVTFLTAFAVLLRALCDEDDLVFGGLVANRINSSSLSIIGPLVNTFALRLNLPKSGTLYSALRLARRVIKGAYRHSELPFERVIEGLKRSKDLPPHFRINAIFDYFKGTPASPDFHGIKTTPVSSILRNRSQVALSFKVRSTENGATLLIDYQSALFDKTSIEKIAALYEVILDALVKHPDSTVQKFCDTWMNCVNGSDEKMTDSCDDISTDLSAKISEPLKEPRIEGVIPRVRAIWALAFNIEDIEIDEDFFELGGHSLVAMRIMYLIEDEFGVAIPMEALFGETATIRTLSEAICAELAKFQALQSE